MIEREMEDLIWEHPDKLLNEQLTKFQRQLGSSVGRSDIIFVDRIGRFLVIEIKRGTLSRGAIEQLHDYYGMMKRKFSDKVVELMVVANRIPPERRLACEKLNIEAREISEKKFRDVAEEVNYIFESEPSSGEEPIGPTKSPLLKPPSVTPRAQKKAWCYWKDQNKKAYFLAFVNGKGACSMRRFDAESGEQLERLPNQSGNYEDKFAEYFKNSQPLYLSHQPNLERDCKERLPEWVMDELRDILGDVRTTKVLRGKQSEQPIRAKNGLLDDSVWRSKLRGYPSSLLCLIRQRLQKEIPGITESFNTNSLYFGYRVGTQKERAYIYIQKEKLRIDLCISRDFELDIRKKGFEIHYSNNFQGRAGWLTGWQIPHLTKDTDAVVTWLCKAFEENL